MRIAIVEDHVLIAKQLVALVVLSGHQAVAASNGTSSSIGSLVASHPELALVDVSLHGRNDGLAISEQLIREYEVPTVFVTANRRRLPASFCNAVGVIDKPFNKLSFEKALAYVVARLTNAVFIPPLPASLILSPLYRRLWIEDPRRCLPKDRAGC